MRAVRRAWAMPMANRKGFFRTTIKYISGRMTMEWMASLETRGKSFKDKTFILHPFFKQFLKIRMLFSFPKDPMRK